jgi:hypothetical protein
MVRKCPPGILCIENYTLLFFVLLIIAILYFMNIKYNQNLNKTHNNHNSHNNKENDVLLNPYSAPLRDDRILNNPSYNGPKIPINVPTQSCNSSYRQIGILTRINGPETILPLLGRPLFSNRDKWNFYTMNDKNGMIKLPISFKNKRCTSSQGCDNLYNGDTVFVEGYSDTFRVTIYDNNTMEYIPYL